MRRRGRVADVAAQPAPPRRPTPVVAFRYRGAGNATNVDVLVEEANHALVARGYAEDEAAVYPDESRPGWGVLRGSLVEETHARRTELLRIVTAFPERDDLVAAKELA